MSTNNTPIRPLENFSASVGVALNSQSAPSKVDSSSSAGDLKVWRPQKPRLNTNVTHNIKTPTSALVQATHPIYALSHANNSTSSLQSSNFTRTKTPNHSSCTDSSSRVMNQTPAQKPGNTDNQHTRKKSATQANIEQHNSSGVRIGKLVNNSSDVNISHVVAQAATVHQTHMRRRSQTVPSRGMETFDFPPETKGFPNTPMKSLTEASWSRESIANSQAHQNIIPSSVHGNLAQIKSIPIISRSPAPSSNIPSLEQTAEKERPLKSEKSKVKFFSRPSKVVISKDKDIKIGLLPSPNMINFTSLQRANNNNNLSTFESHYTGSSVYSNANPSTSTIRPPEGEERKSEKEKSKHHFLSRQKHKLTSKEDYNLPLSSSASNSKPVDPNAPSSLYNFNMPLNSTTTTASFSRGMSGLDIRHGGRALREKKNDKDERPENGFREVEISFQNSNVDKNESSNTGPGGATSYLAASSINLVPSMSVYDASSDIAGCGMEKLGPEDVWPFLRSKLLAVFEGEDLKLPVEDLNRIVLLHLQDTNRKRVKINIIDELKDLLRSGFTLMDQTLRSTPDQLFIPQLVEMWIYTFTAILPLMQAVFLPFDLELINSLSLKEESKTNKDEFCIRSIVLRSFRDSIILSRFENLKNLFHNLHSEIISSCIPDQSMLTSVPESSPVRPGTAMSLDPSVASYGSQNTMVTNSGLQFSRNCKNNTFSGWSGFHYRDRDRAGEGGVQLATIIIGRLLQCIGVLNSVHSSTDDTNDGENIKEKMGELVKDLKVDLLEKKRMGCSRRALIGAKVRVSVRSFGAAIEV